MKSFPTTMCVVALAVSGCIAWTVMRDTMRDMQPTSVASSDVAHDDDVATPPVQTASLPRAMPSPRHASTPEEAQALRDRARADIESRFNDEPVTPEWAARTEARIVQSLSPQALRRLGATVPVADVRAACHSFTCRIEATYADQDDIESAQQALLAGIGGELSSVTGYLDAQPDGTMRTTLYAVAPDGRGSNVHR